MRYYFSEIQSKLASIQIGVDKGELKKCQISQGNELLRYWFPAFILKKTFHRKPFQIELNLNTFLNSIAKCGNYLFFYSKKSKS